MIAGSDFRIGNYALDDDRVIIIDGLKDYVVYYRDKNGLGIEYSVPMAVTEPIPITEEWLLKFGFEKYENADLRYINFEDWIVYQNAGFCIGKEESVFYLVKPEFGSDEEEYFFKQYDLKIEYVHQLQNLFFALTGQELTVRELA